MRQCSVVFSPNAAVTIGVMCCKPNVNKEENRTIENAFKEVSKSDCDIGRFQPQ